MLQPPERCIYDECRVACTDYIEIPQNLSSNVIAMYATGENSYFFTIIIHFIYVSKY